MALLLETILSWHQDIQTGIISPEIHSLSLLSAKTKQAPQVLLQITGGGNAGEPLHHQTGPCSTLYQICHSLCDDVMHTWKPDLEHFVPLCGKSWLFRNNVSCLRRMVYEESEVIK